MMRRSKVFKAALSDLVWPDGSSRWDTTRVNACFHCGKRRADLKRNVCQPCRSDDFIPAGAPVDNPMARGYRVCTDHCTTVPLPLRLFAPGNKKCLSCLEKRRQRKLRKRGTGGASSSGRSAASPSSLEHTPPTAPTSAAKRRRGGASALLTDDEVTQAALLAAAEAYAAALTASRAAPASPPSPPARLVPSRQSARRARRRIAAIGADHDDESEDSVTTLSGDDADERDSESPYVDSPVTSVGSGAGSGAGSGVVLPISPTDVTGPVVAGPPRPCNAAPSAIPDSVRFPVKPPAPICSPPAAQEQLFVFDFGLWSPSVVTPTVVPTTAAPKPLPAPTCRHPTGVVAPPPSIVAPANLTLPSTGCTPFADFEAGVWECDSPFSRAVL